MGTLFPDSPEYPDHKSIPSPIEVPVGTLTLTACAVYFVLLPFCPVVTLPTDDAPRPDYAPQSMVVLTPAPSTTSNLSINVPAGHASITGLAPTGRIG